MKKRVLFLIHSLGFGGAEKVLVNLVNGMDKEVFDVSVRTLFNWGPNRRFLDPAVRFSSWMPRDIPGNSHWTKLWTPEQLWKMIIPEKYDIVVSFLEGICARVIGGCPRDGTKLVSWIHITLTEQTFLEGFRNREEAVRCYRRADRIVCVSEDVRRCFLRLYQPGPGQRADVLHNVFESEKVRTLSRLVPQDPPVDPDRLNWCGVGKLIPRKRWDMMLEVQKKLIGEGFPARFYLLGTGPLRKKLEQSAEELGIRDSVVFTGYQENPYQYLSKCILFVCASEGEGFSTAAVESLLAGTPVCSVEVGGMREILGENNEFGVVTEREPEAFYQAVRRFFADPEYRERYRQKALERSADFETERAVAAVGQMLLAL